MRSREPESSSWKASEASAFVERARRHEDAIPEAARARIWREVRRADGRPVAKAVWPIFLAGAALTGLLVVFLGPSRTHSAVGSKISGSARASLIELRGIADLVVGPNADVRVDRLDAQAVELRLETGSLLVHVLPRLGRGPFIVRTPQFVARVVGTVFRVAVETNGESRIAVAQGTVEVVPEDQPVRFVHARQSFPTTAVVAPSPEELALLPLSAREEVSSEDFAAPRRLPCAGDVNARLRCEITRAQDGQPRDVENALYRAGWIAWRELDDPRRALTLWRQQRERFPNGALRREVQASMIDALVATRSLHEAEMAIESYLEVEPDDLRAPELHFVLGTIEHRLDGNCHRAAAELDLALVHAAAPWAAQAREARRACGRSREP